MVVVGLKNQMGNQMFQYAGVKTIAEEKGYDFRCFFVPTNEKYINSKDIKYGTYIGTLFDINEIEKIESKPEGLNLFLEKSGAKENSYSQSYDPHALEIEDNTIVEGYFESLRYFSHNRKKIIEWFRFHTDTEDKSEILIDDLKRKYPGRPLISVHFRTGKDFTTHGYTLNSSYWIKAAKIAQDDFENPIFVCFYDKLGSEVERFTKTYKSVVLHGSLVEDMCTISKCDGHIICNSTFSIMAAFIDKKDSKTYCPSVYPIMLAYKNIDDYFLKAWKKVPARRSIPAMFYNYLQFINYSFIKRSKQF